MDFAKQREYGLQTMNRIFNVTMGLLLICLSFKIFFERGAAIEFLYNFCITKNMLARSVVVGASVLAAFAGAYIVLNFKKLHFCHYLLRCREINIRPYIFICLCTVLLFLVFIEALLRMRVTGGSENFLSHQILIEEKFPYIAQWGSNFVTASPNRDGQYRDYYIFTNAAPGIDTPLYKTREYYSARDTPDSFSPTDADMVIWTFGGSTMQNMETIDSLTIANQIAVKINDAGIKSIVYNFGTGSFQSSLETIKFIDLLKRVKRNELPQYVVFYDGYNDAGFTYMFGAINLQWDISLKMKALVNQDNAKLFAYSVSNIFAEYSFLWREYLKPRIDYSVFGPTTDAISNNTPENLTKGVDAYEINAKIIRGACAELGITPLFILQPMIFTKKKLTSFEQEALESLSAPQVKFMTQFFNELKLRMSKYHDFYDFSTLLDDSTRNDFYDYGHTGPYTGITIGSKIGDVLLAIQSDSKGVHRSN